MKQLRDHPTIREIELTGYPLDINDSGECPFCHGAQGDWVFVLDGEPVCQECFLDWVKDYTSTNPREVATALAVSVKYVG